jgi:hypothetical protein
VRNNFTHPAGFCQNGHDAWFEYRDLLQKDEWYVRALQLTRLTPQELENQFMDPNNTFIKIYLNDKN